MSNVSSGVTHALVNLTPHSITIQTAAGRTTILPESDPTRVRFETKSLGSISYEGLAVPLVTIEPTSDPSELPAMQPDVYLLVSRSVASAFPKRPDLVVPHDLIRDDSGCVIACRQLAGQGRSIN